ncbi:MAG TPA: aminoglycoside phosphotransferase family protein, partial [Chloroflexota bacterium]|nr:aminoglycoside phosphotransferase family protein [Chloroflexota bacterium]
AATGLFLCAGRADRLRLLLASYGIAELDDRLSKRLLVYTLLHRYRELRWVLDEFVGYIPATLDELASAIYDLT